MFAQGDGDRFGAACRAEFLVQTRDVFFHHLDGNPQPSGDVGVRQPFADGLEDLPVLDQEHADGRHLDGAADGDIRLREVDGGQVDRQRSVGALEQQKMLVEMLARQHLDNAAQPDGFAVKFVIDDTVRRKIAGGDVRDGACLRAGVRDFRPPRVNQMHEVEVRLRQADGLDGLTDTGKRFLQILENDKITFGRLKQRLAAGVNDADRSAGEMRAERGEAFGRDSPQTGDGRRLAATFLGGDENADFVCSR